jgi:hypothetical protein
MLQDVVEKQGGGGVLHLLEKNKGGVVNDPDTWVDDDRINCNMCQHMAQHLHTVNMPSDQFDKIRRENHKANHWMFDIVKIRNGWARVEYMNWQCNGGQRSYIPIDIKHRCDNYKPKQAAHAFNVKEWWE